MLGEQQTGQNAAGTIRAPQQQVQSVAFMDHVQQQLMRILDKLYQPSGKLADAGFYASINKTVDTPTPPTPPDNRRQVIVGLLARIEDQVDTIASQVDNIA